jgi:hypothetical protein
MCSMLALYSPLSVMKIYHIYVYRLYKCLDPNCSHWRPRKTQNARRRPTVPLATVNWTDCTTRPREWINTEKGVKKEVSTVIIHSGKRRNIILHKMVFMSRRSLEAGILVSFAILAVCFAGFFDRNETVDAAPDAGITTSSE